MFAFRYSIFWRFQYDYQHQRKCYDYFHYNGKPWRHHNTTTTTTTYKDGSGNVTYSGTTTGTDGINQAGNNGQGGEKLNLGDAPVFDQSLPTETNFNIKAQGNPVFSTEIFATTASCPAPITFSAMGKDFNIDFSPICALADIIRGIVLMLSAIVAMRAVVTK